ncbi:hypothetical protein GGI23_005882 [Coemansia sp. RSA 2559]|nr:hypothetical protein GGI23_005882 [Coemansia sp. RSA 2559]
MRLPSGQAIGTWFYATWVYQVLLSAAIGTVAGFIARKALKYAETAGWVDKESFLSSSITLTLLLVGVCTVIGTDDIFCCFIAGNSFTWDDWFRIESEDTGLQETLNVLLSMSFFIYFGTIIPWTSYTSENVLDPWRIAVVIILVMCLRRLPTVMLTYKLVPAIRTWQEALFAGWFGPIGVSAVFYSIETIKQLDDNEHSNGGRVSEIVYPIICAIVFGSVLVHGITIPLVLMGKRVRTTLSVSASSVWKQPSRIPIGSLAARRQNRNDGRSDSLANIPEIDIISTIDRDGLPLYTSNPSALGNGIDAQRPLPHILSSTTEVAFDDALANGDSSNGLYTAQHTDGLPLQPEPAAIADEDAR